MTKFSSDILLPFPNSNDLNSRNAVMWGFNPIYKTLRKIHTVSRFTQLLTNSNIWDVIFTRKVSGTFRACPWGKYETEIFRFRHEIFHCYGYLFFHIQCTWWRNFYFMLHIIKGFSTKYVVYENTNIHSNKIFHVCFAILQKITEETCKNVQWK